MLHKCIKPTCGKEYRDNEEEAYYCPDCQIVNKAVAAEIDARMASKPRKAVTSDLQQFEKNAQVFNDPTTGRQIFFGRA